MKFKESKSIYLQIADRICDEILQGQYKEEERIPSVTEQRCCQNGQSRIFRSVNRQTAVKGIAAADNISFHIHASFRGRFYKYTMQNHKKW